MKKREKYVLQKKGRKKSGNAKGEGNPRRSRIKKGRGFKDDAASLFTQRKKKNKKKETSFGKRKEKRLQKKKPKEPASPFRCKYEWPRNDVPEGRILGDAREKKYNKTHKEKI